MSSQGRLGELCYGVLWRVEVWFRRAWQVGQVMVRRGLVRSVGDRHGRRGRDGRGSVWHDPAGHGRHGKLRSGKVLSGTAQVTK